MSVADTGRDILAYLERRGWMGELGVSLLVGVGVGLPIYLSGPGASVWGVPVSLVWGGAVSTGAFLLLASLRAIPSG